MNSKTDRLALAGIEGIRDGMTVGLGTGRAASRAIEALGARGKDGALHVRCVATSERSEAHARALGLDVQPMRDVARVDYLFDGADEVDPALRMLKGRGGAMTREKIVARAAAVRVYLVQEEKIVDRLGRFHRLPIEVVEFGLASIIEQLGAFGLDDCHVRQDGDRGHYQTDNGHRVLDAAIPGVCDVDALAAAIDSVVGVIGHGLFIDEADLVLVEDGDGEVRRLTRREGADEPRAH